MRAKKAISSKKIGIVDLFATGGILLALGLLFIYTPMGGFKKEETAEAKYPYGFLLDYETMSRMREYSLYCSKKCYSANRNVTLGTMSRGTIIEIVKIRVFGISGYVWSPDRYAIIEEANFNPNNLNVSAVVFLLEDGVPVEELGNSHVIMGKEEREYVSSYEVQHEDALYTILFFGSYGNQPFSIHITINVVTPYGRMIPYLTMTGIVLVLFAILLSIIWRKQLIQAKRNTSLKDSII